MGSTEVVTILVAIVGSTSLASIVNALLNIKKASRDEVRDLEDRLDACRKDAIEARRLASSFEHQANDWKLRFNRLEEEGRSEISRWRSEADRWKQEADHWHERWMTEIGR